MNTDIGKSPDSPNETASTSGNSAEAQLPASATPPSVSPSVSSAYEKLFRRRGRWYRFLHWEYLPLCAIVIFTLVFHALAINRPTTIVWDETWYVGEARSIVTGTGDIRPEHPPLAKLFIVAGMELFSGPTGPVNESGATLTLNTTTADNVLNVSNASVFKTGDAIRIDSEQMYINSVNTERNQITVTRAKDGTTANSHNTNQTIYLFHDNSLGWRFFSVVFGIIGIVLFYFICRKLKMPRMAVIIATFLFALENMNFLHGGLALLDVYCITFMLAAVLLYLDGGYWLCGIAVSLSALCKLEGVLIFVAIFLHWLIFRRDKWQWFLSSIPVMAISFVFFLIFFDYFITGTMESPITRIKDMLTLTSINDFTNPPLSISSRPWTWIYPPWVASGYVNAPNVPVIVYSYDPQYISFISFTIQLLVIPTIGYMIYKTIKGNRIAPFVLLWFLATYLVWIPLDIMSNRVTFVFYFLTTTPAICIGLSMALSDAIDKLRERKVRLGRTTHGIRASYAVIAFYLFLHLAIFVLFNPAIPTIIKTWEYPFSIGITTTVTVTSSGYLIPLLSPFLLRSNKNTLNNISPTSPLV